jgi:hypothetical protein
MDSCRETAKRQRRRARRRLLAALAAASGVLAMPAGALATGEVVDSEDGPTPNEVAVEQGNDAPFTQRLEATGTIDCSTNKNNPATAIVDRAYALSRDGTVAGSDPSPPLSFYGDGTPRIPGDPFSCGVTWDGAPDPYQVPSHLSAAPDTPGGDYPFSVKAAVSNPRGGVFTPFAGKLADQDPAQLRARVIAPLQPPLVDVRVNLLPVYGACTYEIPSTSAATLTEPTSVPPGTVLACEGHALVSSDATGNSTEQSIEVSGGARITYTFERPGGGPPLSAPYTEFQLVGSVAASGKARAAASRRRRLWGRGRGRFRTRGSYGSATIRGTAMYVRDGSDGTFMKFRYGCGSAYDGALDRSFRICSGHSYLAGPPGSADGKL